MQKSLEYNRKAWIQSDNSYYLSYPLGSDYFYFGLVEDAINILEIGLQPNNRGYFFNSQLDFSYYELLVKCYLHTGDYDRAVYYLDLAQESILEEIRNKSTPDVIEMQQNKLHNLQLSLEKSR